MYLFTWWCTLEMFPISDLHTKLLLTSTVILHQAPKMRNVWVHHPRERFPGCPCQGSSASETDSTAPERGGYWKRGQSVKHLQSSPYSLVKKIENIAKTAQRSVFWVESVTSKLGKEKKERLLSTAFFTLISACRGNSVGSGILHHTYTNKNIQHVDFLNPLFFQRNKQTILKI